MCTTCNLLKSSKMLYLEQGLHKCVFGLFFLRRVRCSITIELKLHGIGCSKRLNCARGLQLITHIHVNNMHDLYV